MASHRKFEEHGPSSGSGHHPSRDDCDVRLVVRLLPGGARDFALVRDRGDGAESRLGLVELLALDRTSAQIDRVALGSPGLALGLALGRLLVPCLTFAGSGRHLVVEPWGEAELRGETLVADTRTEFARDLAAEQAGVWVAAAAGEPPEGSLAELFWRAHSELPHLPDEFEDPDLGRLARALYFHLVSAGEGPAELDYVHVVAPRLRECRDDVFAPLGLGIERRRLKALFRRLLAVAVRHSGQLAGAVASELILERLPAGSPRTTDAERALIEVFYGAVKELGDVHLGLIAGSGPVLAALVDDYVLAVAGIAGAPAPREAAEALRAAMKLLGEFRRRRKAARAQERREDRERRPKPPPRGRRVQAQGEPDRGAVDPAKDAEDRDQLEFLRLLLADIKPRNRARVQALIDAGGSRRDAAAALGLTQEAFSRQYRQTVRPDLLLKASKRGREPAG